MKKLILIVFMVSVICSVSALKLYVADGTANYYKFTELPIAIDKLGENHYNITGTFATVPFNDKCSTLLLNNGNNSVARCIIVAKDNCNMEVYTPFALEGLDFDSFAIQISKGHALWCRNILINETAGYVDPSDIYVGTIGLFFNLFGVAEAFDIDVVSISQSGMNDNYNVEYGQKFHDAGKLIVHAHGSNDHELYDYTTYIGDIVTVSYCGGTYKNKGTYGDGLEFLVQYATTQSQATPILAGMFVKLREETGKSWSEIREAMREVSTRGSFRKPKEGYGIVNYELVLKELAIPSKFIITIKGRYWVRCLKEFNVRGKIYRVPMVTRHNSSAMIFENINDLKQVKKYIPSAMEVYK